MGNKNAKGIDKLRSRLIEVAKEMPALQELLPSSYLKIEEMVVSERANLSVPVMNWEDFGSLCLRSGVSQSTAILAHLNATGVIIHVPDENSVSHSKVVIGPHWLARCMGSIVGIASTFGRRTGVLTT